MNILYVKINSTLWKKPKKFRYESEFINPNGQHVVTAMSGTTSHGGYPAEFDIKEVEFLFPLELRRPITDLRVVKDQV